MEFFKQHQVKIFRGLGAFMLLLGFVIHFWTVPKEGLSENERAAANIARMAVHTNVSSTHTQSKKENHSKFLDKIKAQQEKQLEYLTILVMFLGACSLGYSFLKRSN